MLKEIMSKQRELQLRLGTDFGKLDARERAQFMKDHFVYLDQELQEALYEMPFFKAWKDYSNMSEEDQVAAWDKVKMELVDSLHFFVNLMLCADMSADDVYNMYMAKNAENHRRQDEGYTSDKSYKEQSVEDVMSLVTSRSACNVTLGDEKHDAKDFVAILVEEDGRNIYYNTNVLNLGHAAKIATQVFYEELKKCDEATRAEIEDKLFGGEVDG